jgi:23S rRNA (adenine1618-N6)-methyltransferase
MIGRKLSLKVLTAKLWTLGVAAVRTTEFVQGHTSRWGLAWSFTVPPKMESSKTSVQIKSNVSFMLEVM